MRSVPMFRRALSNPEVWRILQRISIASREYFARNQLESSRLGHNKVMIVMVVVAKRWARVVWRKRAMTWPLAFRRTQLLGSRARPSFLPPRPLAARELSFWPFAWFKRAMDSPDTSLGKRPAPADATASEPDAKAPRLAASPKRGKAKEKTPPRDKRRGTRTEPRADDAERAPRLPKRQCALLIGFAGTGYSGMQMYVHCCLQAGSPR
jgi:hypothetical protein